MYKIPLFDLNFDERETEAVVKTLKSKWLSMGPQCEELENKFNRMLNTRYSVSLSNNTAALHLAMLALDIKEGDEVIVPSYTFVASVNCIRYVNAKPVFVDIVSLNDLSMNPDEVEKNITEKTKAILVVHFGGFPVDMDAIMNIAKRHNLKVIEDACHGPLSEYKGKKLGSIGDVGCFSFFSNKNISTGEGGVLTTDNKKIYEKVKLLRSHGMTTMSYQRASGHATSYDVIDLGYNYRMDDIRASIGNVQLDKLQSDLDSRVQVRRWYVEKLSKLKSISVPYSGNKEFVSNYIMPIILNNSNIEKRDEVRKKLQDAGIQTSNHYPAIHRFSIYKEYSRSLPITEYVADNEITLPMYSKLKEKDIDYVVDMLEEILDESNNLN
jgi:dTDP-4-amino-4,6-dideoxygalactose transaminase